MDKREGEEKWAELRQRRWSWGDARWALSQWAASGMSVAAFARSVGVAENRLYGWRTQLSKRPEGERRMPAAEFQLVPVSICQEPASESGAKARAVGGTALVVSTSSVRIEVCELSPTSRSWVAALLGIGSSS